jgi:protein-disulfide isomerase
VRHVRETEPKILKEYVETGKLRHVFMDFPLAMHKLAFKASEAGLCAGDQGKFWEMSHKLFDNQTKNRKHLEKDNLVKYAEALGLNMTKFKACLDNGKHVAAIKKRIAEGQSKAGMTGTPAFLFGFIQPNGTVKAVKKNVGASPYAKFKGIIDELLAKGK